MRFLDLGTGEVTPRARLAVQEHPWVASSWSRDGTTYAAHDGCQSGDCSESSVVSLVDSRSGQVLRSRSIVPEPPFFAMTYTADGASLLVVDNSGEMRPVDAADLQPAKRTIGDGVDCRLR